MSADACKEVMSFSRFLASLPWISSELRDTVPVTSSVTWYVNKLQLSAILCCHVALAHQLSTCNKHSSQNGLSLTLLHLGDQCSRSRLHLPSLGPGQLYSSMFRKGAMRGACSSPCRLH